MTNKIPVILNKSYGRFQYSQLAVDNFNVRNMLRNHRSTRKTNLEVENTRFHPIMAEVLSELGEKANGIGSILEVEYIPVILLHYIKIENNDGFEVLDYDLNAFKLDRIRDICIQNIDSDVKIKIIEEIIEADIRYWIF